MDPKLMDAAAVPTICGWLEWVKPFVPERYWKFLPVVAVGLGVLYAFTLRERSDSAIQSVATGLVLGLTASGAWSAAKNMLEARKTQ